MSDEPKSYSEKLRALRDEFNDMATKAKAMVGKLDLAISEARTAEYRADMDKVLDKFIPTVDKSPLKGHDVVFLINKAEDMGDGFFSPIGAATTTASTLSAAVSGHDAAVSACLFESGNHTRWLALNDSDRMEKAREKTKSTAKELLPVVKDIMVSNTPDKQSERQKHYIVVCTGSVTDNIDHSAQMINTAMQMNPRVTFDFITIGAGEGNIKDLVAKITPSNEAQKPGHINVAKHEEFEGAVMCVLTGRFKGEAPKHVEAPKPVEAPKVAETPVAAPVAAEPPKLPEAKPVETPPAAVEKIEPPKAEAPAVVATPAAEQKKKRFSFFGRG